MLILIASCAAGFLFGFFVLGGIMHWAFSANNASKG